MLYSLIHDFESELQQWLPASLASLQQSPVVQSLPDPLFAQHQVAVDALRCDLLHPVISGNKWFKLKYNLVSARRQGLDRVASFGGAWSNHLHALAYCARELRLQSLGFVRGEELDADANVMLQDVQRWGMELQFLSRQQYRLKQVQTDAHTLLIPEGGDNRLGVIGSMTMVPLSLAVQYDVIVLPWGTGCTALGVRLAAPRRTAVWAVSALKGAWLQGELARRLQEWPELANAPIELLGEYHHGGYGNVSEVLLSFIREFGDNNALPLDPVYSGKAMWGLCDRIRHHALPAGSRVLFVHTGGLQGTRGFQS